MYGFRHRSAGAGDVVRGIEPFCTSEFGVALERIARGAGSSDTSIWVQNGIESVNLSVGYQFEHTSDEELDVAACYGTYKFLMEILDESLRLRGGERLVNNIIGRIGRYLREYYSDKSLNCIMKKWKPI